MNAELSQYREIIEDLQETNKPLLEVLETHDREDLEEDFDFNNYLNRHIYRCEDCGWWEPVEDMHGAGTCEDCEDEKCTA